MVVKTGDRQLAQAHEKSLKMSKKSVKDVRRATRVAGGATLTKIARSAVLNKVFRVLRNHPVNIQIKSLSDLKAAHVKRYVDELLKSGTGHRTIQNHLAHIRQAMRASNRAEYADSESMSTKTMGVSGASRSGTHRPLNKLQYRAALAGMKSINPGAACCMALQRELGLRAREAIQSVPSLKVWARSLKTNRPCEIIHGTKGGRKRQLAALSRERAIEVVETAIQLAKAQEGKLIVAKNLQAAARAYCRACAKVGLVGEYASHSIRCSYAQDRYKMYEKLYDDKRESLALVSIDLGHGDGRGKYVEQVYLKNSARE